MTLSPIRRPVRRDLSTSGGTFLRRVFGLDARDGENPGVGEVFGPPGAHVVGRFHDESNPSISITSTVTAIHVLWCADEATATISIGLNAVGLRRLPISPGDTLTLPADYAWQVATGVVVFVAEGEGDGPATIVESTHGLDVFEGFNRRTVCAATPGLMLERWKITQPCPVTVHPDQPLAIVNLLDPIAIVWDGGIDNVDRMDARIITPATGKISVVPDGLAYILVTRVPDMKRDVLDPLQASGFSDAQIASLSADH